jgi:AraC family transcriptional regulator of adaptative response/methylated-DNA-[protein]-cysteine methyltransferase
MGDFSYTTAQLTRAREKFGEACAELLAARRAMAQGLDIGKVYSARVDALLAASLDLEIIQEVMRMEGNFPLDSSDQTHLHLETLSWFEIRADWPRRPGYVFATAPGPGVVRVQPQGHLAMASIRHFASPGASPKHITAGVAESSLGKVLVAKSEKGLCAVLFDDHEELLWADLRRRYPKSVIEKAAAKDQTWIEGVVHLAEVPTDRLEAPLDVYGTAFQQRVWQALLDVPPGKTTTYGEIARKIGSPQSVRAVAQACGANPLSVVIPCHRVVAGDGSLSGYRWGIKRKRALLDAEKAVH